MILVDSGYFIALFNRGDTLNPLATRWSLAITEPLLVTEYVLVEVINYFSRQPFRLRALTIADSVTGGDYEFVASDSLLLESGLKQFRQTKDKDWSLTDCISFQVMRQRGITRALAYDHHFEQAGFEALMRREPS